jgi:hypothetical protein
LGDRKYHGLRKVIGNYEIADDDPVLPIQFGYGEARMSRGISQGRLFRSCINHTRKYSQSREARQCVGGAQIAICAVEKLKKADYVRESQIYGLKDTYNTGYIYFSEIDAQNIAKMAE